MESPKTHLKHALIFCISISFGLGNLDTLARLLSRNIEWFDVHLTILTHLIIFSPLVPIIALSSYICERFAIVSLKTFALYYWLIGITLIVLLLGEILLVNLLAIDLLNLAESERQLIVGFALTVLLLALMLAVFESRKLTAVFSSGRFAYVKRLLSNYLFLMSILCGFLLGYDLWQLNFLSIQAASSTKPHPNIILITLDTVRADHLEPYGYQQPNSPNLKKLAENSVVFSQARSNSPWTLPSHASLFTGKQIWRHGAHGRHQLLKQDHSTLAEVLSINGYQTAGFVAGPYGMRRYGLGQGFQYYSDRLDFFEFRHNPEFLSLQWLLRSVAPQLVYTIFQADGERTASELNQAVKGWLDCITTGPFFLFINYFDAHNPYNLGQEERHRFTDKTFDEGDVGRLITDYGYDLDLRYKRKNADPALVEFIKAQYDAEILYLDQHLGRLFDYLKQRDLFENSVLIITADHGEEFFEHGGVLHSQTLYDEVLHVPLIIHAPKLFKPGRIDTPVALLDLYSTVLNLAEVSGIPAYDSQSLLPLIRNQPGYQAGRQLLELYGRTKYQEVSSLGVLEGDDKFISHDHPRERLPQAIFELSMDPGEQANLYSGSSSKIELEKRFQHFPDAVKLMQNGDNSR